jgi:hypothetical protein
MSWCCVHDQDTKYVRASHAAMRVSHVYLTKQQEQTLRNTRQHLDDKRLQHGRGKKLPAVSQIKECPEKPLSAF